MITYGLGVRNAVALKNGTALTIFAVRYTGV